MRAELVIRRPSRAHEAICHVATDRQVCELAAAIIDSRDVHYTALLLHGCHGKQFRLPLALLKRAAEVVLQGARPSQHNSVPEQLMECFSLLPAHPRLARVRMRLLQRLLHGPVKVWLKGEGIGHNVHSNLFRNEAQFLPAELNAMFGVVERSRNHEWVDTLGGFRPGLFSSQWERLQLMAIHFHALKERREGRKQAAA